MISHAAGRERTGITAKEGGKLEAHRSVLLQPTDRRRKDVRAGGVGSLPASWRARQCEKRNEKERSESARPRAGEGKGW